MWVHLGRYWLSLETGRVPFSKGQVRVLWPFWTRLRLWIVEDSAEAEETLQSNLQKLAEDPNNAGLRFMVGNNYRMMARFDEARAEYSRVAEGSDKNWAYQAHQLLETYPGGIWEHDAVLRESIKVSNEWIAGPWQIGRNVQKKDQGKLIDIWRRRRQK